MDYHIKVASVEDAEAVAKIGRETFYETWRPVNTEEDMQEYMSVSFDLEKIKKEIKDERVNTFLIAYADNEIVGYAKLRRDRSYPELEGKKALEVERIYVVKSFQDKKAGKALMDRSIEIAKQENCVYIWLGVNTDNEKAIRFYKKYGFTIFGEKNFQLGNAVDTDYLMKKDLN
jgi:diamine N-acetyltransferase